jgi:hypothetical protein
VCSGVFVVGLDDVSEQDGGAAVGVGELERLVGASLSVAGGEADDEQQRQRQQERGVAVLCRHCGQQPHRSEHEVDREHEREL